MSSSQEWQECAEKALIEMRASADAAHAKTAVRDFEAALVHLMDVEHRSEMARRHLRLALEQQAREAGPPRRS